MITGEGKFVNLSEKGALMVSPKPLKVRQTIRLHVQSAGSSPLELSGRVIWTRKQRPGFIYGIEFDSDAPSLAPHP
jgi:PilZ domain